MRQIKTLDLVLTHSEHVEIELQSRAVAPIMDDEGQQGFTKRGAVLYVSVDGVTVCRIYGIAGNFTINDRRETR